MTVNQLNCGKRTQARANQIPNNTNILLYVQKTNMCLIVAAITKAKKFAENTSLANTCEQSGKALHITI